MLAISSINDRTCSSFHLTLQRYEKFVYLPIFFRKKTLKRTLLEIASYCGKHVSL